MRYYHTAIKLRCLQVLLCLPLLSAAQTPLVFFNHALLVLDSSDYRLFSTSSFVKDSLAGFFSRSTQTGTTSWSGAYLFGASTYLELFPPSGSDHADGTAAFALSTETVGDLDQLKAILGKQHLVHTEIKNRKLADTLVPWFQALYFDDTGVSGRAVINCWLMEYEMSWFLFNHLDTSNNSVKRSGYLASHRTERQDKYLADITGIVFYASETEIAYYTKLLLHCGLTKTAEGSLQTPDHFRISFTKSTHRHKYPVQQITFSTAKPIHKDIRISENILLHLKGKTGSLNFNE